MVWFLRAIEQPDGSWTCRRGREDHDNHESLHDAVEHLKTLAVEIGGAELFLHRLDGSVDLCGPIG
jgi:hypothetical protein